MTCKGCSVRLSRFESSFPSFFTPGMKRDDAGCKARILNFRGESFLFSPTKSSDIPTYYGRTGCELRSRLG